jgi:hypothetical protein
VPQDVAHYGNRIADYIEQHSNHIASEIRDVLESATWLPESMRPPRSQPSHFFSRAPPPPQSFYDKTLAWVSRNRTAIAIVVAFAGTTAVLIHRRRRAHARKRRAKKFANGAKKEIVVLACSTFHDPLTRSLALDLERRGYIVYITVSSTEEDSLVQSETKPDIRPLWMDLTSTVPNPAVDIHPNLEPIRELLNRSSRSTSPASAKSSQSTTSQNLSLAGLVVLPGSSGYPVGPFLTVPPSELVDTVNTRLISSLLTVQQFLPLLMNDNDDGKSGSSIIIAYPSIPLSLLPPYQVPSLLTTSSLSTFAKSLRREVNMQSLNIHITELKLGNFDLGSTYARATNTSANASDLESLVQGQSSALTHWHSSQRAALQRSSLGQTSLVRGSALREFHNAVFDSLAPPQRFMAFGVFGWGTTHRPSLVYVGSGARLYDVFGKIVPQGLVGWMMDNNHRRWHSRGAKLAEAASAAKQEASSTSAWGSSSLAASESGIWEKVYV